MLGTSAAFARVGWPHIVNVFLFGVSGLVLLAGGGRDRRLPLLGGLFLTISAAFGTALMPSIGGSLGGLLSALLRSLRPEAFLPLMLWRFVRAFPADIQQPGARRFASVFVNISYGVGGALFVGSAVAGLGDSAMPAWLTALSALLDRNNQPERVYWPLLFAIAAPAIPFLLRKTQLETREERRRVLLFVGALGGGLTPFVLAVVATPFVPALWDPLVQQRVGVVLYGALASVVPVTVYSVAVNRVMDLQFVVRTTLKYALARWAVWVAGLGPLAYLAVDIQANQQLTIAEYLERFRPAGPLAVAAAGLIALALRQHLLRAIDRWFFLEPPDQSKTLARLEQEYRAATGLRHVTAALARELGGVLRASSVAVLLVNDDGTEFVPVEGTTARLSADSALLEILRSTRRDTQLDSHLMRSLARLLPPADKEWLDDADAHLLCPLVGATGMLLGLVAVGETWTGLPYSASHYALVTAACGRAAMQIENRRLRGGEDNPSPVGDNAAPRGLDWQDEPASHCPACSLVWSPQTRRCSCGTATCVAAVPLFIQGKFRLERLVGRGGMGVVYLAVDMVLDRQVDGTEQWRGTPMLIVEYLDGGTLRDWIQRGPVSYAEAIDLGIVLADVLDRVHESGVLHRDVKPSNIGYTSDGRPKLLDFGLALIDRTRESGRTAPPASDRAREALIRLPDPAATVTDAAGLVGTPLYLSPEALAGSAPRPSFDLWGLALVLYEALAGCHPFASDDVATVLAAAERADVPDIRDYRSTCPAGLAAFLRDALSPNVNRRPPSAGAMRSELYRLRARDEVFGL